MANNKKAFVFLLVVVLISLLCIIFILFPLENGNAKIAEIYINGELYESIDISDTTINREIEIRTEYGTNTVLIQNGMICVKEADCPDKTCVNTGWTNSRANPVICIPHRLEIVIDDFSEIDGVVR